MSSSISAGLGEKLWSHLGAALSVALLAVGCAGGGSPGTVTGPMVAAPVMAWLVTQDEFPVEAPIFVLAEWDERAYDTFDEPDLPGSSALFETTPMDLHGALDAATRDAVAAALGALGPAEFVEELSEAEDRAAQEHLGCYPFRGNGTLLVIGAPLHPIAPADEQNRRLLVSARVARSCAGGVWLLELNWDGEQYGVRRLQGAMFAV